MNPYLVLCDEYSLEAQELLHSLTHAEIPFLAVFCQYHGSLPPGSLSPFTYYTGLQAHSHSRTCQPLFFNEVPIPQWAEIRQDRNQYGEILLDGFLIGKINYQPETFRRVDSVEWLDRTESTTSQDFYNQCGTKYATAYFSHGQPYQTVYLNISDAAPHASMIEVCHRTNIITLRHATSSGSRRASLGSHVQQSQPQQSQAQQQPQLLHFTSLAQFVSHFLDDMQIDDSHTLINSLSHPLFVMRMRSSRPRTTLFWQEPLPTVPPGNMDTELKEPVALTQIIFHDVSQLHKVRSLYPSTSVHLAYLSHLDRFQESHDYSMRRAFILTNTDDIPGLEHILSSLPDLTVCVAALTTMSDKLMKLSGQYSNLHLRPVINRSGITEELRKASIYLDINAGHHVYNIVKAAYHLNLLTLATQAQAKEPQLELLAPTIDELLTWLKQAVSSTDARSQLVHALHTQAGPQSTVADYTHALTSVRTLTS